MEVTAEQQLRAAATAAAKAVKKAAAAESLATKSGTSGKSAGKKTTDGQQHEREVEGDMPPELQNADTSSGDDDGGVINPTAETTTNDPIETTTTNGTQAVQDSIATASSQHEDCANDGMQTHNATPTTTNQMQINANGGVQQQQSQGQQQQQQQGRQQRPTRTVVYKPRTSDGQIAELVGGAPPIIRGVCATPAARPEPTRPIPSATMNVAMIVSQAAQSIAATFFGTSDFCRLPKTKDYDQRAVYATRLKVDFESIAAAIAFEEGFRRNAVLRAAKMLLVRDPGVESVLFLLGVADEVRIGTPTSRCTVKEVQAPKTLSMGTAVQAVTTTQAEVYWLQGPRHAMEKFAEGVGKTRRIGVESGVDILEGAGVPVGDWKEHLLGMKMSHVVETSKTKTRAATVKLVFGKYSSVAARFTRAGTLAKELNAEVLLAGFDIRIVKKEQWLTTERERAKKLEGVHAIFADTPPVEAKSIGDTPDSDTIVNRALAVEEPGKAGVMVYAKRGTNPEAWTMIAAFLSGHLLACNCISAAIAIPIARLSEVVNASIDGMFSIRAPVADAG